MIKYTLLLFFFFIVKVFPQVVVYADSIVFPSILTGTSDSVSYSVINPTDQTVEFQIHNLKSVYNISDTMLIVGPLDSSFISIKYSPNQNVIDNDLLIIKTSDSTKGKVIGLKGSAIFGDGYDAATFNLYDAQLKSALTQLVNNHTSLGYNLARDKMYMEIDNKRVNGQGATVNTLECVYTGRLAVGYTSRADAQNNFNFNTEHTWPQSTFNENEPMKSDLYHLYPTDVNANSIRSNYPFGNVVSGVTWDSAGSKLGRNSLNQIVFEPRDVHKGDVSRAMFYFIIRYPQNYGGFFTAIQENVFREWNEMDNIGTIESARNNAIASFQLRRNPFIDHPEFVERVFSFATNNPRPLFPELDVLPSKINFDSTMINDSSFQYIYLASTGSAQLVIDSITTTDSRFSAVNYNSVIDPYSHKKLSIKFNPDLITNYTAILTVFSNGGQKEVLLTGIGSDKIVGVDDKFFSPVAFSLEQNYPNPFNPVTKIKYTIPESGSPLPGGARGGLVMLKVYDILGSEVATLVNEYKSVGKYEVEFEATNFPSGIYFYQLRAGNFLETKKMILLR